MRRNIVPTNRNKTESSDNLGDLHSAVKEKTIWFKPIKSQYFVKGTFLTYFMARQELAIQSMNLRYVQRHIGPMNIINAQSLRVLKTFVREDLIDSLRA